MGALLLAGRLVLAGVFVVAGVAKLADLAGSRRAVAGFGVPERLAGPLGVVLPLAELAAAFALVPSVSARWGGLGALVLLAAFTAGIVVSLVRGRQPDCHCFGQLRSEPVGWQTLARNLLLGGVAVFVVVGGWRDPGVSATHWLARLDTAGAVGLAAGLVVAGLAGFLVWFCFQVLRQNGRILARLEAIEARLGGVPAGAIPSSNGHVEEWRPGLPVGTPAPEFELPDLDGELVSLEDLMGRGLRVLLVFSDPGCGPCGELMPDVGRWQREHAERFRLVVLSRGEAEENREKASEFGLELLLLQEDREVGDLFECYGTPGAVLIDANGLVASPVAQGSDEIAELVARASDPLGVMQVAGTNGNHPGQDAFSRVGEPAPSLELPDLDGSTVKLTDLLGERVLLLFWNPQCGFCQQMLSDLKAWEADPPEGAPGLIVVSTGGVEDNRAQGLRSTVLLDHDFSAGSAFGAGGTPMAVLIDADGNTASEVVGGAQAVFDLANTPAQDMVAR